MKNMGDPVLEAESSITVFTADERPDLWERARPLGNEWPEYNRHGNHTAAYFGALIPQHAHLQVLLYDNTLERVDERAAHRTRPGT